MAVNKSAIYAGVAFALLFVGAISVVMLVHLNEKGDKTSILNAFYASSS